MSTDGPEPHGTSRRRKVLLAIGALVGASVVWGWLSPAPEEEDLSPLPGETESPAAVIGEGDTSAPAPVGAALEDGSGASTAMSVAATDRAPTWVRPTILWAVAVVIAVIAGVELLGLLTDVVTYLVLALFFSFALDPAVTYMNTTWHWRRGASTGLLLLLVLLGLVVLVLVFVPTLLKGAAALAERLPSAAADLQIWAKEHLGIDVSTSSLQSGGQDAAESLTTASHSPLSALLGFTASLVGGIFALFTVAMFIFYMVAEGPQFRRAILALFTPKRQEELLTIWEAAIEKTGGYFYSRLLLAAVNGGLFYVVLRILEVPGAAPLAFFEGTVAAFIPIVGTYIAATVPIVMTFIANGSTDALILLAYVLVYQQVENYLLSPRIQGKTMRLHPALAFGAALAGGAIGGLLWAFLALPFAATVQASASQWIHLHEVVESDLTKVAPQPEPRPPRRRRVDEPQPESGWRIVRSTRGWIRKVL